MRQIGFSKISTAIFSVALISLTSIAAIANPAQAVPATPRIQLTSASAATPHLSAGVSLTFTMANGHHYSTGQPNPVAGNQIIQTTAPGRTFTFSDDSMVGPFSAGTLKLANGNFMAANAACTGVTIKSNSGSNGTVWYLMNLTTGNFAVASRFCMHANGDHEVIYGDNTLGDQWKFCDFGPNADTCATGTAKFYQMAD